MQEIQSRHLVSLDTCPSAVSLAHSLPGATIKTSDGNLHSRDGHVRGCVSRLSAGHPTLMYVHVPSHTCGQQWQSRSNEGEVNVS